MCQMNTRLMSDTCGVHLHSVQVHSTCADHGRCAMHTDHGRQCFIDYTILIVHLSINTVVTQSDNLFLIIILLYILY